VAGENMINVQTLDVKTDVKSDFESPIEVLPGFIHINHKKSGLYGVWCKSTFVKDGKVYHEREYLGKLIDPEKCIYHNRQRGYFTFNLTDGYNEAELLDITRTIIPQNVVLHFGDIWLVDQILKQTGLSNILDILIPDLSNTIKSLVAFRLLNSNGYDSAEEWYRTSYARILYPDSIMTSSMTSKYIAKLGQDEVYYKFFNSYLQKLSNDNYIKGETSFPILIDSTGLPNDIKSYLTAINNHNGVISNEIRLIYVVDKNTKLPIYFRYVPGNLIDNSVLSNTMNSLAAYGLNICLVIIDAGFSSLDNLTQLIESKISFITRMTKNRKEYKELIKKFGSELQCGENAISFGERTLYGKKTIINLCGTQLYAYIMLDSQQKVDDEKYIFKKYKDDPDRINKINESLGTIGKFILVSSDDFDINEILPLYYNRQTIEQVFDISKNIGDLIPLRAHHDKTIAGRLLLSFIATIIYMHISKNLGDYKMCANKVLFHMHNLKIKIYESNRLLEELTKIQKEIFIKLNLDCPYTEENGNMLKKGSFLANFKSGLTRGRGRPKGSKNQSIIRAGQPISSDNPIENFPVRRGRPKGSKNKANTQTHPCQDSLEVKISRKRGRPKGSKNRTKILENSAN
jgi:transposase